jgi:glycosyltransferase involved in cell wall biosynthesis
MNNKPFFSIAIPSKDRSELLHDLISSILDQDFTDYQIVIADNSVDKSSLKMVDSFCSNQINYIKTEGLKMSENWNACINASSGSYLVLMSDKTVLKKGALRFLYEILKHKNKKCITWNLDQLVGGDVYISEPTVEHSHDIKSDNLLRKMLGSDWIGFDDSPMHSNSCISMDLVDKIKDRFGSLCMELNPDYTMATHILLSIEGIYRLNTNLTILQRPSLESSHGNGSSFLKKTSLADGFMNDHISWRKNGYKNAEIPIDGDSFILNIMLKDVYAVLKLHKVDPDIYLDREKRVVTYYHYTFKEILWRMSMGIEMKNEMKSWDDAFFRESFKVKIKVYKRNSSLYFYNLISRIKFVVKNADNIFLDKLLSNYRTVKYTNIGVRYKDINEMLKDNNI